jgi:NADH-quinone oxidoreductase subunit G
VDVEKIITVDGRKIAYDREETVLEVCENNGIKIPHMCFQKNLTPSGHCGLCVIELSKDAAESDWIPVLTCLLPPQEGMILRTHSKIIAAVRELAGQLLLRSHPCDCDFCEKFGNCELRKIYNKTGFGFTRAIEDGKHQKPILSRISGRFLLDREKCTNCGLCVTFFREELGEYFLHSVLKPNGQARLELYPGASYQPEGYLLNAIEICPYNAIVDAESLGLPPPWQLRVIDGISTESSRGNNIKIFAQGNEILYVKPRKNPNVADYIPDSVRDIFRSNGKNRSDHPLLHGQKMEIREVILFILGKLGFGHRCAMICSGSLSLENMLFVRQLANVLGAKIFVKNHRQEGDGWLISGDRDTNIRGALVTQVVKREAVDDFSEVEQMISGRQIQTLIVFNEDILALGFSKENFAKVDTITFTCHGNETAKNSHVVLPICSIFEEHGHFIGDNFLLQRFHRAIICQTEAKPLWLWLAMIENIYLRKSAAETESQTIENIWNFMEKSFPEFRDIRFAELPPMGIFLDDSRFKNYPFIA